MRIAIVGLGIGGGVAAAALNAKGLDLDVYEQAPAITEVGAGVSIGPNAVRPLRALGFGPLLERVGWEIGSASISDASGSLREFIPTIAAADGTPGVQCHRADLLNAIVDRIPPNRIHLDHRCVSARQSGDVVQLRFANGAEAECDLLIAADGFRSPILQSILNPGEPIFSGLVAYRGLVDAHDLPGHDGGDLVSEEYRKSCFWTDGERYLLRYPVSSGRQLNFVGVVPASGLPESNWYGEAPLADLQREFAGWCAPVQQIVASVRQTFRWAMFYRRPLPRIVHGRIALLGDAAHPMVIHAGQGAGQAIEDAFALAGLLAEATPATVESRLEIYNDMRLPRTAAVQRQSLANAQYMTRGILIADADRQVSNTALGGRGWLYDYDIVAETQKMLAHEDAKA